MNRASDPPEPTPWWRVGMVWMVVGGPAVVVVAAIATAAVAVHGADRVVIDSKPVPAAEQPALQGRNHAATPR